MMHFKQILPVHYEAILYVQKQSPGKTTVCGKYLLKFQQNVEETQVDRELFLETFLKRGSPP